MTFPSSLKLKKKPIEDVSEKSKSNVPSSLKLKETSKEISPEQESFGKSAARYAAQIPLGLSQATTPGMLANLMQIIGVGDALDPEEMDRIKAIAEREGVPFSERDYLEAVRQASESFPTPSNLARMAEEKTGIPLTPKTTGQELLQFGASLGKGALKGKLSPKTLSPEEQALRETAEQFGLRKFAGMEAEKPPMITPIVSAKKEAQLVSELGESSKQAIDKIIDQKVPIKKMRDMGINLEDAYTTAYSSANKTASKMGDQPVDFSNVISWIDKEIDKTKSLAPSPSAQQKTYINILDSEKNNLIGKTVNANQALNQYKNFNANQKGIWRKPEFSGSESSVIDAYTNLNQQLMKSIEKASPNLGRELQFANKIFGQTQKLEQVEGLLSKAFDKGYDANKLSKILSAKRGRKFIERNLGKDGVQDLEKIAKYGQKAEEKVFNQLKNPKTVKEYLENITPTELALLAGFKAHAGMLYYIPKAVIHRVQGYLFTRNATKKAYLSLLKESANLGKNPTPLFLSANKLNKAITDEFGSEEELLKMSSQEE